MTIYEPMSAMLEQAEEEYNNDYQDDMIVAPATQAAEELDADTNIDTSLHPDECEPTDIGPALGLPPVIQNPDDIQLIPKIMSDNDFFVLVSTFSKQ